MFRLLLSKFSKHPLLWTAGAVLALFFVAAPHLASADIGLFDLNNVTQTFVSTLVFGITWLISLIAGVIIGIQTWFLQVILSISFGLVNSNIVKIGFPMVLGVANLFFVGALIAIAIATIIRQHEYGAKKVLWKLVVMAVMVNFGLVICGSLLSLSDETTKFFINSVSPVGRDSTGEVNFAKFSESIVGAFNPAALILSTGDVSENPALAKEELSSWAAEGGDDVANVIKPIVAVLSTLGSFILIIITLATLNMMLLWRYIRIGMALIVLPLAWAAWIFPAYQEHYKKWWTKFVQWTLFPPVVVFFIWLGLKISEVMSQQTGEFKPLFQSPEGNPISDFLGNLFAPIVSQTLKTFILFGIMMGGIVAAQELGIHFAAAGYKAIETTGGWAKGKAMNYAKRAGRATYQGAGGRKLNASLAKNEWGQGIKNRFGRAVVTTIGSGAASLGRGMSSVTQAGGSEVVEDYKKGIPHDTAGILARLKGNNNMPEVLALLSALSADELSKVENVGGIKLAEWLEKYHQKIEDYEQHDLEKSLKDMGATHAVISAAMGHGKLSLEEAVKQAMKDGDPKVLSKLLKNGGGLGLGDAQTAALHKAIIKGMKETFAPKDLSAFIAEMGKGQLDNFETAMKGVVRNAAEANTELGEENADLFRKNAGVRSRGMTSERLWNQTGRSEGNDDISGGGGGGGKRKGKGKTREAPQAPTHAPTPAPHPTPTAAPSAPAGGGGGGGGGGGHH